MCQVCGCAFKQKKQMEIHILKKHNNSETATVSPVN